MLPKKDKYKSKKTFYSQNDDNSFFIEPRFENLVYVLNFAYFNFRKLTLNLNNGLKK